MMPTMMQSLTSKQRPMMKQWLTTEKANNTMTGNN